MRIQILILGFKGLATKLTMLHNNQGQLLTLNVSTSMTDTQIY